MAKFFLKARWFFFAALLLLLLSVSFGLPYALKPDNSLKVWFLKSDKGLEAYKVFHENFGNDEVILVFLEPKGGIFNKESLKKIRNVSTELEEIKGVHKVHSLLTALAIKDSKNGITFAKLIPKKEPSKEELGEMKNKITNNAFFKNKLISSDGTKAMIWAQMEVMDNIDQKRDAIVASTREVLDKHFKNDIYAMAGTGVIYSALNEITQRDFALFVLIGYVLIFLIIYFLFRNIKIVLTTFAVVIFATMATLGIYGLLGNQLNMVTVVLPTLIIVLGIADIIHFPVAFARLKNENKQISRIENVQMTIKEVFMPCLLTTLTTMAGFLALATSPMAAIRQLGLYAALGLFLALLASFVMLSILFLRMKNEVKFFNLKRIFKFLNFCLHCVKTKRATLTVLSFIILFIFSIGAYFVEVDTNTLGYFPKNHQVIKDHKMIEERWGPYAVLDLLIKPKNGLRVDDPKIVLASEKFVNEAVKTHHVRYGIGLFDIYKYLGKGFAFLKNEEALSPQMIYQLQLLIDGSPSSEEFLAPYMTKNGKLGRMLVVGNMGSAKTLDTNIKELMVIAKATMGDVATIEPAGYPPMYIKIVDYIMQSQIQGLLLAIVAIFLLMLVWLKSIKLALISLIPNLFPVVVMMGAMGFCGIDLDVATATVAAIVIGVSIDDTVHFLHYFKKSIIKKLSFNKSMEYCFKNAGAPAVVTTLILLVGYPVLMLAQVRTVVYFGFLVTISAMAALFADLVILPLLLRLCFTKNEG
ncbi:MMPL family transporter [Sulfobacillus acidophilus]|uniref:MMPL family transporter n=1 Tax=Sulfobacillus acidophilus TaxID=53633 RepID=A0ABS3AYK6_9FIRM|nr:MMPL family transporter [Sulfobacillus acidophilus]